MPPTSSPESIGQLVQHVVASSVDQLLTLEPGGLLGPVVHQYRVAIRRLRCDLATFSEVMPSGADEVRCELRVLGRAVGAVRDLDVLGLRLDEHR